MDTRDWPLSCPSASEQLPDSKVFALVVDAEGPIRLGYLDPQAVESLPVALDHTQAILGRTNARFTAACQESRCGNFSSGRCSLSKKIVTHLSPVVDALPKCAIRSTCRWFFEERGEACLRCPQVVTVSFSTEPHIGVPLAGVEPGSRDSWAERVFPDTTQPLDVQAVPGAQD
jgi:hypothetical protein